MSEIENTYSRISVRIDLALYHISVVSFFVKFKGDARNMNYTYITYIGEGGAQ